ncbi:hypothetical protein FQR65_LT08474 [Abscondita terminalis]|nr:hypothetical protein FQR65_LT08474 [Abscondita terminalis]
MIRLSVIFFLLIINVPNSIFQQIFNEELSCKFKNNMMPKNEQNIVLKNTLWDITGRGKNADTHVRFSLCDKLTYFDGCDPNAAVCIYNKNKPEKNVRNAGEYFVYTSDDNGKKILKSMNGEKCDDLETFTVIIQFESNPEMNSKPKFVYMDDCELRVEMMWPMYNPPCTTMESGYMIDLRSLKKLPSFSINNPRNNHNYSLSICQQSQICGDHVSGCEMIEESVIPLGRVEYERITYTKNGNLIIKSHFGENKRSKRSYELHLKCNWKSNGISNLVLFAEGKTVKFKADSSLACIKIPNYCHVRNQHMLYDLHKLSRNYEVRNVTTGSIKINVCNSLNLPLERNDCTDEYSQVCYQSKTNEILNLGSIAKNFEVTPDHTVRGSFQDGSTCSVNRNLTYSTEIEFICNAVEEGPVLIDISGCTYRMKWLTPAACPLNSPHLDNCVLQDSTASNINLNSLYKLTDTRIPLPGSSSFLRYNVCGPLRLPCDNDTNAAVCYVEGNKELVVGVFNKRLLLENEVITLHLRGENNDCSTKIKFHCNQMIPKTIGEQVRVDIIKEKCNFEVNVETPLACGKTITSNCTFRNEILSYNLSGLSRVDDNYRIQLDNEIYFLNLCRSVLRIDNMCSLTSAVCLKKLDEPHIQYKYESLGSATKMEYFIDRGDLIISLEQGSYCRESDSLSKTSSIRFQCAEAEEGIKLLQNGKCHYEFLWSTPHACPIRVSSLQMRSLTSLCTIRSINSTKAIDLSNFEIKPHIYMNSSRSYKLDLCSSEYLECTSSLNSNCTLKNASREVLSDSSNLYLSYLLDRSCDPYKNPNRINFFLICEEIDYRLEVINVTTCVFNINLKTKTACENKTLQINEQSCKNENVQVINLKNANIASASGTVYTLNFENTTSSCKGVICKGSSSVLSPSDSKCPNIKYDYANSFGLLEYNSGNHCNSNIDTYVSQFLLKCNFEVDTPTILEESECKVVIQYPLPEMCSIFNLSIVSAKSTGVAVGVGVGLEYLLECSIPALPYLADLRYHWTERIFWIISVILSWGLGVYVMISSYDQFKNNPVSFTVDTSYLKWTTNFPAVIFCEKGNDKYLEYANNYFDLKRDDSLDKVLQNIAFFKGVFDGSSYQCKPNLEYATCPAATTNFTAVTNAIRSNCEEIFGFCSWNEKSFNCCTEIVPLKTVYGICYGINSLSGNRIEHSISMTVTSVGKKSVGTFTVELINADVNVFVLSSEELPSYYDSNNIVFDGKIEYSRLNEKNLVYLSIEDTVNEPDVESLSPDVRQCRFPKENYLTTSKMYSYPACIMECLQKLHLQSCNCTHHLMPEAERNRVCDWNGLLCLSDKFDSLLEKAANCDCSSSCIESDVKMYGAIKFSNYTTFKNNGSTTLISLILRGPTIRYIRKVVNGYLDLIVYMGGTAGLCVGASLLTIVEFFYFIIVRPLNNCINRPFPFQN